MTGFTGFLGRHVTALLQKEGNPIRGLSRHGTAPAQGLEVVVGDVTEESSCARLVAGCADVVHLAGVAHSTLRTRADRDRAWRANVEGTQTLLQAAAKAGVRRLLLVSSAQVYASHSGTDVPEDAACGDPNFYARTKLAIEAMALEHASRGTFQVVIARPCLSYGPGARFNLERLLRSVQRGYYFHLAADAPQRSFLSVYNAAAAFVHLLRRGRAGEAYNVADEHTRSLPAFVNEIAERMSRPHPRTLPSVLMKTAVATLRPLRRSNLPYVEAVHKLTEPFTLSVAKLRATGFAWPDPGERAMAEMVAAFLQSRRRGAVSAR